jgi:hypothetical protein
MGGTYAVGVTDGRMQVQVTLTEKTVQRPNPVWNEEKRWSVARYLYDPTGRLALILDDESYGWGFGCPRKWRDAKGHFVEERVEEAVASIRHALEAKWKSHLEIEERRKRDLERERLRVEEQRQEKEEEQRVEQLRSWARAWRECERLRAFIAAWERVTEADGNLIEHGSPEDAWRRWAFSAIDQLDPLVSD